MRTRFLCSMMLAAGLLAGCGNGDEVPTLDLVGTDVIGTDLAGVDVITADNLVPDEGRDNEPVDLGSVDAKADTADPDVVDPDTTLDDTNVPDAETPDVADVIDDNPCGAALNPSCSEKRCQIAGGADGVCQEDQDSNCTCLPWDPCSQGINPECVERACDDGDPATLNDACRLLVQDGNATCACGGTVIVLIHVRTS